MRKIDQDGLAYVIWCLGHIGANNDNGWEEMVIPFIRDAWPKKLEFQTEKTSKAWVSMLKDTQENFPDILKAVRKLLRPVRSSDLDLYYGFWYEKGENELLTVKFPGETLDLLDLIVPYDPRYVPYGLSQTLNLLLETDPGMETNRRYERLRELEASR